MTDSAPIMAVAGKPQRIDPGFQLFFLGLLLIAAQYGLRPPVAAGRVYRDSGGSLDRRGDGSNRCPGERD